MSKSRRTGDQRKRIPRAADKPAHGTKRVLTIDQLREELYKGIVAARKNVTHILQRNTLDPRIMDLIRADEEQAQQRRRLMAQGTTGEGEWNPELPYPGMNDTEVGVDYNDTASDETIRARLIRFTKPYDPNSEALRSIYPAVKRGLFKERRERFQALQERQERTLIELLEGARAKINSAVQKNTGTAIVPRGIAILSPGSFVMSSVMTIAVPQWQLPEHRPNTIRTMCRNVKNKAQCYRMLDPRLSQKDCPYTVDVGQETSRIIDGFIRQYQATANPEYYSVMFARICKLYQDENVCANETRTIHVRRKRFIFGIVALAVGVAGTIIGVKPKVNYGT
jgi:hypothetical protein